MRVNLKIILIVAIAICPIISYGETVPTAKTGYHINKNYDLVPNDKKGNKKVILITIDDGPSKYGRDMADTLVKHKAGGIFFINGIHDKNNQGNIKYQYDHGFLIGNHTWSHINVKREKNLDIVKQEIDKDTKLIKDITGTAPKFFRPPYGEINSKVKDVIKKDNMISINWSGSAMDWEANTKDENIFMNNVIKDLHPGEIILIHEHPQTAKYLDKLLTTLEEKGYSFADPNQITQ